MKNCDTTESTLVARSSCRTITMQDRGQIRALTSANFSGQFLNKDRNVTVDFAHRRTVVLMLRHNLLRNLSVVPALALIILMIGQVEARRADA